MRNDAESTDGDRRRLREELAELVAAFSDGELSAPPPFDLATSAALALNEHGADVAQKMFDVQATRVPTYQVLIVQKCDEFEREVINTCVQNQDLLAAVLDGFLDELEARRNP